MVSGKRRFPKLKGQGKDPWSWEEDEILRRAVQLCGEAGQVWGKVASFFTRRDNTQCMQRWRYILHPATVAGPFTPEEDAKVSLSFIHQYSFIISS